MESQIDSRKKDSLSELTQRRGASSRIYICHPRSIFSDAEIQILGNDLLNFNKVGICTIWSETCSEDGCFV